MKKAKRLMDLVEFSDVDLKKTLKQLKAIEELGVDEVDDDEFYAIIESHETPSSPFMLESKDLKTKTLLNILKRAK